MTIIVAYNQQDNRVLTVLLFVSNFAHICYASAVLYDAYNKAEWGNTYVSK
jgi:hypothetical protein